jgi:hypothetical protein
MMASTTPVGMSTRSIFARSESPAGVLLFAGPEAIHVSFGGG